jgi:hypothetical protein
MKAAEESLVTKKCGGREKKWWNKAKEQKSENVLERVRGGKR